MHAPDQAAHGDRAGVDHRIERAPGAGVEDDGVEGVAAGLDAHVTEHLVAPEQLQREAVAERLRHRLDRERALGVPARGQTSVDRRERDAECIGLDGGELGDVGRDLPGGVGQASLVDAREPRFQGGVRRVRDIDGGVHRRGFTARVHRPGRGRANAR